MSDVVKIENLKVLIIEIRGHGVLLDSYATQWRTDCQEFWMMICKSVTLKQRLH